MAHTPRKWLAPLVILCVAAYLTTYAVINVFGFPLFADADMYTDTLVARLMWEQKTLFPNGWIFGNQFYIASTPVLAALFYGLVSNTNTAMILATSCMGLFLILSFSYCVRSFVKGILPCLIGLLALMAAIFAPDFPRTPCAQLFFLQASYYSCYLITFFVVVGDYARAFQSPQLRLAPWLLSCTLSFAMGMQSLRQTVAMALPIVAYEGFLALRRLVQKQPLFTPPRTPYSAAGAELFGGQSAGPLCHFPACAILCQHLRLYGNCVPRFLAGQAGQDLALLFLDFRLEILLRPGVLPGACPYQRFFRRSRFPGGSLPAGQYP